MRRPREYCGTIHRCGGWLFGSLFLLTVIFVLSRHKDPQVQAASTVSPSQLDVLDDGKQLKLLVRHREIGPVCELWCYEGGPFRYGTASKREDGSVVFVHTSGKLIATTTFTPSGEDRILMDILLDGPAEEMKEVTYMGPCMQFWHSDGFKQQGNLVEFARRCFLYTMRGPVGLMDTARGPMKGFKPDAPENNPPYTQWYVPTERPHPGDIWAFGASGDRPLYGTIGVESRDGRWLAAIGCAYSRTLGQGWHDCIHIVPGIHGYAEKHGNQLRHRSVLYVMPNDKRKLLENFRQDFPSQENLAQIEVSAGEGGTLTVQSRLQKMPGLKVSMDVQGGAIRKEDQRTAWKNSPWGGFVRRGSSWQMWAWPQGDTLDVWVSLAQRPGSAWIEAALGGQGWQPAGNPKGVPALVRRSSDGTAIAALIWERSETGNPARGVAVSSQPQDVASVRGRLYFIRGGVESIHERWVKSEEEWKHSLPYRMPLDDSAGAARAEGVRFVVFGETPLDKILASFQ